MWVQDWQVEQQDVETDEPDLEGDIKDLEFRLTNNLDKLQVCYHELLIYSKWFYIAINWIHKYIDYSYSSIYDIVCSVTVSKQVRGNIVPSINF